MAVVVAATTASAAPRSCNELLGRAVRRYVRRRWAAIAGCEQRKLRGKLPAAANCCPGEGPVSDGRTAALLGRARRRLALRLQDACPGPLPPLGPACDGAADAAALADCIAAASQEPDSAQANVDSLIATVYGTQPGGIGRGEQRCVRAIARAVGRYLRRRMRILARCAAGASSNACPGPVEVARLVAAREKFAAAVRRRCSAAELTGGLAFGAPCEQYRYTVYRRSATDGISNTIDEVARLTRCVGAASAAVADAMEAIAAPGVEESPFDAGVAAGDATDSAVVFWTELPDPHSGATLEIATDPGFASVVRTVAVGAPGPVHGGTVKVDVTGLTPATTYYYRFRQGGATSRTGRVRTAASAAEPAVVRFGWSGDADAYFRPLRVLDTLAAEDLDAWFFIGDTIYGDDDRPDGVVAMTEEDYLAKHRLARADASLRYLLASTGTYAQWDDHEVLNDFSGTVPAFASRMAAGNAAFRAYYPVREDPTDPMRLYRSFRWGDAAEFFILDDRQYRSPKIVCCNPPDPPIEVVLEDPGIFGECPLGGQVLLPGAACLAALADPSRTYLGAEQKAWLEAGLLSSTAAFKFVMNGPPLSELKLQPYDRWEAYPAERAEILDFIAANGIKNVIWLSTDLHALVISPQRVDAAPSHFVPEIVSGPIGVETIFREIAVLAPDVLPSLPLFPSLLPHVGEFDLNRFNVVVATVDSRTSPATARFDFLDRTGEKIASTVFTAGP